MKPCRVVLKYFLGMFWFQTRNHFIWSMINDMLVHAEFKRWKKEKHLSIDCFHFAHLVNIFVFIYFARVHSYYALLSGLLAIFVIASVLYRWTWINFLSNEDNNNKKVEIHSLSCAVFLHVCYRVSCMVMKSISTSFIDSLLVYNLSFNSKLIGVSAFQYQKL